MLSILRIKNLALADDITVEFFPGYNVITGETGAGKSVLIGAISLALGERADRDALRSGADRLTVEATFDIPDLVDTIDPILESCGLEPCEDGRLIVKRVISRNGANKQFVNGSATSLANVARIGDLLVDIHGPHDHQSLFQPVRQLDILDAFGALEALRARFADLVDERLATVNRVSELTGNAADFDREIERLRYQSEEIANARLDPDEEETIDRDYQRASNAAQLLGLAQNVVSILDGEEASAERLLTQAGRALAEMRALDPDLLSLCERHEEATELFRELVSDIRRYADDMDLDPHQLSQLESRYSLIQDLKRKYGPDIPSILLKKTEIDERLEQLGSREEELESLRHRIESLEREMLEAGVQLTKKRKALGPKLSKIVTQELERLGFLQSKFEIAVDSSKETSKATRRGFDRIEFRFAPNPGEPFKPLRAIASSGEMARVMLAVKTALASADSVPLLVFDEVDANVGGETATQVGLKMKEIGRSRQTLCITHLPSVAAAGDHHFLVRKSVVNNRAVTEIEPLSNATRIEELTRMLGGASKAARSHAIELLDSMKNV